MSRVTLANPIRPPSSSWIASMTTFAQKRAILAHAPTFGFKSSLPSGDRQGALRDPVLLILRDVKPGEMLTNDLARPITLDALGARVPVGDDPLRIEHEDGVVCYALDEQAETAFALAKPIERTGQLSGAFFNALFQRGIEAARHLVGLFAG